MKLRTKMLIAAAAVALAGTPAFAGDEKGKEGDWFAKMDADGDGAISREEAQKWRKDHFTEADGDGDGGVTLDEMKAHHAKMMEGKEHDEGHLEEHFKEMDGNSDGKVTMEEVDARSEFDEIDADKDGKVTKAEADAHKAKHEEEHKH